MESIENAIIKLNELITDSNSNPVEIIHNLLSIKQKYEIRFKILDFGYYNELLLNKSQTEKVKAIKVQNFEKAAAQRDLEAKCQKYIDIKRKYNINKSIFIYQDNILLFLYFGTSNTEKKAKEYLDALIKI